MQTEAAFANTAAWQRAWLPVQLAVFAVGVAIFAALLWWPEIGLYALWNVLIPVAPALLVVAPGVWRNVCPMAFVALLPRRLGVSARRRVSADLSGRLQLAGVFLLLAIVPLRHVVMDLSGPATALMLGAAAAVAAGAGFLVEWKSGWCSGLCPIHPVERLYGSKPCVSPANAHCLPCERCVAPCPDSTPGITPLGNGHTPARRLAGILMTGGFAGFVWGWFLVSDYSGSEGWRHLGEAFGLPLAGMAVSLLAYLGLRQALPTRRHPALGAAFAAAAVSAYYWFRIPALFGFGYIPGDGMLVDLQSTLPLWFPAVSRLLTTSFFFWWLCWRPMPARAWTRRPPFSARAAIPTPASR